MNKISVNVNDVQVVDKPSYESLWEAIRRMGILKITCPIHVVFLVVGSFISHRSLGPLLKALMCSCGKMLVPVRDGSGEIVELKVEEL